MRLKKSLSAFIACMLMPISAFAYTATCDEIVTVGSDSYITLNGNLGGVTAETKVLVSVFPEGTTMEQALADNSKIVYSDEILTEADGSFMIKFKMNDNRSSSQRYDIHIYGANVNTPITRDFLYTTAADRARLEGIFTQQGGFAQTDVNDLISTYAENVGLTNFTVFNGIDKTADAVTGTSTYAVNVFNAAQTAAVADTESFVEVAHSMAYIEAYNQSKTDLVTEKVDVVGVDGKTVQETRLKDCAPYVTVNADLKSKFETEINEDGKGAALKTVAGKAYTTVSAWEEAFEEALFIQRIVNSSEAGYGHIQSIFAEPDLHGLDLTNYSTLLKNDTEKRKAESILASASATTIAELQTALDNAVSAVIAGRIQQVQQNTVSTPNSSSRPIVFPNPNDLQNVTIHKIPETPVDNGQNTSGKRYSDLGNYGWAEEAINYLSANNIVSGVADGVYEPGRAIVREELIKMIVTAFVNVPTGTEEKSNYLDDPGNAWYSPYLSIAEDEGFINGYDNGDFGVGDVMTRQDCATVICRIAEAKYPEKLANTAEKFADDANIADYAREAVYKLAGAGVINGMDDNSFAPEKPATRAEIAVMLYRFINL